jgi:cell division protein FtsL
MVDLAPGLESKNYGLRKTPDPQTLWDSLKILFPLAMIAGALSIYIWIYSENTFIGYQNQSLSEQRDAALKIEQQLILEEQILKDPQWVEATARRDLGMVVLKADQIITALPRNRDAGGTDALAWKTTYRSTDSGKTSTLN